MQIAVWPGYGVWQVSGPGLPTQTAVNISGPTVFTVRFAPLETVYFNETGLPAGTPWNVSISPSVAQGGPASQNGTTTGGSVSFVVVKGSWTFQIVSGSHLWVAVPGHGTVTVPAHSSTKHVRFKPV